MSVQLLVYIYLFVSVSMIVFNVCHVYLYNSDDGTYRRRSKSINKIVTDQILAIEKGESLSEKQIRMITRKCRNMWFLDAWDDRVTLLSKDHEKAVQQYVLIMTAMFRSLSVDMKKKPPVQQAHFAHVIWKYSIAKNDPGGMIISYILSLTSSPNLYCRENAMKVLYAYGNVDYILQALDKIGYGDTFHNDKLLVDGLLTFSGDHEELMSRLLEECEYQNDFLQQVILNYVRFQGGEYRDYFWNILQDEEEDDEIRFIAIRYFAKITDERAEKWIKNVAQHPQDQRWEYAAISAGSLGAYPGEETVEILKQCLCHGNWYIRYNAALSLERLNISSRELEDILEGDDRYAREVLEYRIRMRQYEKESKEAKR